MSEILEGGCSCGAVRYRINARPLFTQCCHCTDCQRQTGGPFAINGMIETSNIELISGAPIIIDMPSPSGRGHEIHRCPSCQTALWSNYGRRSWLRFLRIAALDKPSAITPDAHIFTRSKLPWVILPEGMRAFEVYYDMNKEWPPERLARWQAAKAAG